MNAGTRNLEPLATMADNPTPKAPRLIETVRAAWASNLQSVRTFAETDPSRRAEYLKAADDYAEAIAILDAGVAQVRGAK